MSGLRKLTDLRMGVVDGVSGREVWETLCQLKRLRVLQIDASIDSQGLWLVTQLKKLTSLCNTRIKRMYVTSKVQSWGGYVDT